MEEPSYLNSIRVKSPKPDPQHSAESSFARLKERIAAADLGKLRHLNSIYQKWAIAASVALILAIGGMLYLSTSPRELELDVATNVSGKVKRLTLADGTTVAMNVGSKLIYPKAFTASRREVFLVGEAYFEVAHNARKPFTVRAGDLGINVLGTKFNVKAYPNDKYITTTLLEGKVVVENTITKANQPLTPNQAAVYNQASGVSSTETRAEAANSISWLQGTIKMDEMSLEDICLQLERVYNVRITIVTESLKHKRFNGEFHYNENLEDFLQVLQITTAFKYQISKGTVIIS